MNEVPVHTQAPVHSPEAKVCWRIGTIIPSPEKDNPARSKEIS